MSYSSVSHWILFLCSSWTLNNVATKESETGHVTSLMPNSTPFSVLEPTPVPAPTIIVNISEPYTHIVAKDSILRLTCTATSLKQWPVTISWHKYGEILENGRAHDEGNGNFLLIQAQVSDSGIYICSANDQETKVEKNVTVVVRESKRVRPSPMTVEIFEPYTHVVAVGQSVRLKCVALASKLRLEPISLSWSKYGERLDNERMHDDGKGNLLLTQAKTSDSGIYICSAYDHLINYVVENVTVIVQDSSVPKVKITSKIPTVIPEYEVGSLVMINCEATGVPLPTVEWIHNNGSSVGRSVPGTSVQTMLQFAPVSITDSGTYTCRAKNSLGTDSKNITIYVKENSVFPKWNLSEYT